jgi:hypothetical protein
MSAQPGDRTHAGASENTRLTSSATAVSTRTITLGLEYQISEGPVGQMAEVTVTSLEDSLGLLTAADVSAGQAINSGRPQLPSLSIDAVYGATRVPRGAVVWSGEASEYRFDPIVTRVITDQVYDATEPEHEVAGWFPTQPMKVNRLGSHVGGGGNLGRLVLYPAQFQGASADGGTLRAFEELQLVIYYEDSAVADDWQPPMIRRVETALGTDRVQVVAEVSDPDPGVGQPSGVAQVTLFYTANGVSWTSARGTDVGETWRFGIDVPAGSSAGQLRFVVQAVDGAGNVTWCGNKGRLYGGAESRLYLPLVLRDRD